MKSGKPKKLLKEVPQNEWLRQVKAQTGKDLHFLWYERFYGNPEGSLSKMLNKKVERNPQRPEVEDSITNNTSVGSKKYA